MGIVKVKKISELSNNTYTFLACILGIILGCFSKYLDLLVVTNENFIVGILDSLGNTLGNIAIWILIASAMAIYSKSAKRAGINVFLFFSFMNISYHSYTIYFGGFNPKFYMMIWYGITLISPIMAVICYFAKSDYKYSSILRVFLLIGMMVVTYFVGDNYIGIYGGYEILFLIIFILMFWQDKKQSLKEVGIAIICRSILSLVFYI